MTCDSELVIRRLQHARMRAQRSRRGKVQSTIHDQDHELQQTEGDGRAESPYIELRAVGQDVKYISFIIAEKAKAGCKKNECDRCSKDLMS